MHWILLAIPLGLAAPTAELDRCAVSIDRGEFLQAARQLQKYERLHPKSLSAHIMLARAYMGLNQGNEALKELRGALVLDPNSLEVLYYVSKLTGVLSRQQLGAVAELAPDSARLHQIKAQALEAQGDAAGAEHEYLAALEKRQPGTSFVQNALGDLKRHQKDFSAASEWYARVLEKDPENYDALYGAGACLFLAHSPALAVPLFRRALHSDPASIAARLALGDALLLSGKAQEALPFLEEAAKSGPQLRRLQYLLGRAYSAAGRQREADAAFMRWHQLRESALDKEMSFEGETP